MNADVLAALHKAFIEDAWIFILIRILVIVVTTLIIHRCIRKLWRKNEDNTHYLFRRFLYNIIQATIYLLGILFAIDQIPQLSSIVKTLLAGSGIIALGISLSAQESLNNIVSGLFIAIFKPFEVGNRIRIVEGNITGLVEDITLRHTIIKTFTNTRVVIPNSTMNKSIIENSNLIDSRASSYIDIQVAYESDVRKAIEIMSEVVGGHPKYLDIRTPEDIEQDKPKVKVYVRELGDSGISLRASMWTKTVDENFDACSDIRLQLKERYDAEGIEIPYTKYTILQEKEK